MRASSDSNRGEGEKAQVPKCYAALESGLICGASCAMPAIDHMRLAFGTTTQGKFLMQQTTGATSQGSTVNEARRFMKDCAVLIPRNHCSTAMRDFAEIASLRAFTAFRSTRIDP